MSVPVTTVSELLQQKPTSPGVPVGNGDWRLVVERMEANVAGGGTLAIVGQSRVGTTANGGDGHKIGGLAWSDFTPKVRGMSWFRGADEQHGRPRVGEINVTVDTRDHANDPFENYSKTRPGVIMRCGLVSDTDPRAGGWLPQWCALVDQWPVSYVPSVNHVADSFADVVLVETLSSLARIDDNATSLVGSGEKIIARIDRLLTAARWRYGRVVADNFFEGNITLQSTDMSLNRLAEIYLTADSAGGIVRSDVTGAALITTYFDPFLPTRLGAFSTHPTLGAPTIVLAPIDHDTSGTAWFIGYNVETLEVANDPEGIFNDHRYARVGGTQQVVEHTVSVGRFGRSTKARSDLICETDGYALFVAFTDNVRQSKSALRVENVEIVATGEPDVLLAVAAIDYADNVQFHPPHDTSRYAIGRIRSLSHEIGAMDGNSIDWRASYSIDFSDSNVPGAVLAEIDPPF